MIIKIGLCLTLVLAEFAGGVLACVSMATTASQLAASFITILVLLWTLLGMAWLLRRS